MATVLLLGGELQTLSMARGLKDCGHEVVCLGAKDSTAKYCRFVDRFIAESVEDLTVLALKEFIQRSNIDVVIPTEDEYALWLSHNKNAIENEIPVKCAVEGPEKLEMVLNKTTLLNFCQLHGIPHPRTVRLSEQNLKEAGSYVGFPALIKPSVSNGARGITLVQNEKELANLAPTVVKEFGECALQEYLNKQKHYFNGMLYRYSDGTFSSSVVTRISRFYPIKGGSSSYCTTIENPQIIQMCQQLLNELGWMGFADFDILENEEGDYRIIEINPRVPASVHAAYVSGINFGQIIMADELSLPRPTMVYTPGKHLRYLGLDIAWFVVSPERFRHHWFKFFNADLHYQEGGVKDWKAMCFSMYKGIKKQLSPSFRNSKRGMN